MRTQRFTVVSLTSLVILGSSLVAIAQAADAIEIDLIVLMILLSGVMPKRMSDPGFKSSTNRPQSTVPADSSRQHRLETVERERIPGNG